MLFPVLLDNHAPPDGLTTDAEPPAAASFEALYAQLQQAIQRLETGGLGLEDSLRLYEHGMQLASDCERLIRQAELRVSRLSGTDTLPVQDEPLTDAEAAF